MTTKYKVAKIIDEFTIIINAGSNYGIKIGDRFQILDKEGNAVKDPDSNEVIGYLDLIKDTVTVTEVHEKMCFCTSPEQIPAVNNIISGIHNINESLWKSEKKKLNIDLSQVTGGLRKSNVPIYVGDLVKLIKSSK